jgi:hypothetical protein
MIQMRFLLGLYFSPLICTLSFFGCHSDEGPGKTANSSHGPIATRLSDTTWITNKQPIHAIIQRITYDRISLGIIINGQLLFTDTISGAETFKPAFTDFNTDGYTDIILPPYIYLYDTQKNNFAFVDGLKEYQNPVQLKSDSSLYFSYEDAGCKGMNWISNLFKIEQYKTIKIGHLYAKGCTDNVLENPQMIGVYKVGIDHDQSEELVEKLPYLKYISGDTSKQDFLAKYWNRNYRKFE